MSNYPNIKEIKSLNDIPFEEFDLMDCIAFDLDDTVFIESIKIMRTANYHKRKQFVEGLRSVGGNERVSFLFDQLTYQLMEQCLLVLLETHDINTIGFTARRTGYATPDQKQSAEDKTLNTLKSLNVKFESVFSDYEFANTNSLNPQYMDNLIDPTLRPFDLPGNVLIKDNVIFCNNIDKGIVLRMIFNTTQYIPNKFILIDDKFDNLISVNQAITDLGLNIKFIGYHYTKALDLDSTVDCMMVETQMKYLLGDLPVLIGDIH
jgi:hypothetical protein